MTSSHVILKNPSGAACGEGPVYIGDAAQQVCSDEKLRLEKSTIHQTVRAQNMPYQPLSIKTHFLLRMGGGGGGWSALADFNHQELSLYFTKIYWRTRFWKKKFAKSNTCCHSNGVSYALFSQTSTF